MKTETRQEEQIISKRRSKRNQRRGERHEYKMKPDIINFMIRDDSIHPLCRSANVAKMLNFSVACKRASDSDWREIMKYLCKFHYVSKIEFSNAKLLFFVDNFSLSIFLALKTLIPEWLHHWKISLIEMLEGHYVMLNWKDFNPFSRSGQISPTEKWIKQEKIIKSSCKIILNGKHKSH